MSLKSGGGGVGLAAKEYGYGETYNQSRDRTQEGGGLKKSFCVHHLSSIQKGLDLASVFSQKSEIFGGKSEIFGNYIINKPKDQ